jgi:hypothetical protein
MQFTKLGIGNPKQANKAEETGKKCVGARKTE